MSTTHGTVFEQLDELLRPLELRAVRALSLVSNDQLASGTFTEDPGFLLCKFKARADTHCPFELHFGRAAEYSNLFSFFVGLGADFCNLEPIATAEDASQIAGDLAGFLRSVVECESTIGAHGLESESYVLSALVVERRPVQLRYVAPGPRRGLGRRRVERRSYAPWIRGTGR